jgi:hypothetical protein
MIALMSIGALCDVLFINLTRRMIRWAGNMASVPKLLGVIALNLLLAAFLLGPGLLIARTAFTAKKELYLECIVIVSLLNIFDAVISLLFVLLPLTLLIHRLFWPLMSRPLFEIQYIGTRGRRAILLAIGVALLSASVFGGKFPELLKDLIKTFGG